jgi:hypothetical protein
MTINDTKVTSVAQTTLLAFIASTSFITAVATSYIGWELFKFVIALQKLAEQWQKLGN